jgi:hypothetical protein
LVVFCGGADFRSVERCELRWAGAFPATLAADASPRLLYETAGVLRYHLQNKRGNRRLGWPAARGFNARSANL